MACHPEYGRSKEAGEQKLRDTLPAHYIVRTSWVHGVEGNNFAKTMLGLARDNDTVTVVDDQFGSPTFTFDLALAIRQLVTSGRYGTYHLTNSGSCSWFDLARRVFAVAGVDCVVTPTDTATFGALAPRPLYSVLDNLVARHTGLTPLPPWEESLEKLIAELGAGPSR